MSSNSVLGLPRVCPRRVHMSVLSGTGLDAFSGYPRDVTDMANHDRRRRASAESPVRIAPGRPCRLVQAVDRA